MITNDEGEELFVTPMLGRVIDNKDPKGLCRIQVHVQSLYDDENEGSPWAKPIGMSGVGNGVWSPPPEGAQVLLLFRAGDPDYAWYMRAMHEQSKRPEYVQRAIDESPSEMIGEVTSQIHTFESEAWEVTCDDRPGQELFRARAKGVGSQDPEGSSLMFEMDRKRGVLAISAPVGIAINTRGRIVLNGVDIILGDRPVIQGIAKGV